MKRNKLHLPVDSTVMGVVAHLGEVYLKIQVVPSRHEVTSLRFFYAFGPDAGYMKNPNLGFIDSVKIGETFWFVFEDDFYYPGEDDV